LSTSTDAASCSPARSSRSPSPMSRSIPR